MSFFFIITFINNIYNKVNMTKLSVVLLLLGSSKQDKIENNKAITSPDMDEMSQALLAIKQRVNIENTRIEKFDKQYTKGFDMQTELLQDKADIDNSIYMAADF